MWHKIREIPECNKSVLIAGDDGRFSLAFIRSVEEWAPYIKQGYDKWLYCDDIMDKDSPEEFNLDFVRRLRQDCEFAAKQLREYPSKKACFRHAASTMSNVWMTMYDVEWEMERAERK